MKIIKNNNGEEHPRQMIVLGAPGTGKSYWLQSICQESQLPDSQVFRVTFHPELSYGDFVGVYKPAPVYVTTGAEVYSDKMVPLEIIKDGKAKSLLPIVRYEYKAGPLVNAYCEAIKNPDKDYVIIIEEINRASPATVFGDILQLLDRGPDNASMYPVRTSSDLAQTLAERGVPNPDELRLPSNLFIWGTMNRADESVNYVDSAFLRRWDTVYLPYNTAAAYDDDTVFCPHLCTWKELRTEINSRLAKIRDIEDDKYVGPYFLGRHELLNSNRVFSKLITYLWHDVVPMDRDKLFKPGSLSELYAEWSNGNPILLIGD